MPDLERLEFDILVLNVGMNPGGRRYDDLDLAEVEECVHMNVMVHLKFLKACPYKKVAFINSVTSLVGVPNYALYCASKAFISVFNEALVREGKDTYIVYPYKVNTELFKEMRDFGTIDKTRLARLIVSDLERGVRQRTVPCIFALVPLLRALLPTCVITGLVRLMMRFLSR
ncbi:hypothetical protein PAPHI01_1222 [Pancytospora philotis]|nr:hypothetical protein PAPHI01_1222 [Pancytospora philotis]